MCGRETWRQSAARALVVQQASLSGMVGRAREHAAKATAVGAVAKDPVDLALQDVGALVAAHVGQRERVVTAKAHLQTRCHSF